MQDKAEEETDYWRRLKGRFVILENKEKYIKRRKSKTPQKRKRHAEDWERNRNQCNMQTKGKQPKININTCKRQTSNWKHTVSKSKGFYHGPKNRKVGCCLPGTRKWAVNLRVKRILMGLGKIKICCFSPVQTKADTANSTGTDEG